jgi:hypothetical protein
MNILQAMEAMDNGHRVRHQSWEPGIFAKKINTVDYGFVGSRLPGPMTLLGPVARCGWEVVREQFDFLEAARRMSNGKATRRAVWYTGIRCFEENAQLVVTHQSRTGLYLETRDFVATDWEECE